MEKSSKIKFHENPSSGSRVAPCGQTDRRKDRQTDAQTDRQTDRQTDMTKLIVALIDFGKAPKKKSKYTLK